jgi:hypothetical protein
LQTEACLQSLFVPASITAVGPHVRALLLFFSRTWVRRTSGPHSRGGAFWGGHGFDKAFRGSPFFSPVALRTGSLRMRRFAAAPLYKQLPAVCPRTSGQRTSGPTPGVFYLVLKEGPGGVPVPPRMTLLRGFCLRMGVLPHQRGRGNAVSPLYIPRYAAIRGVPRSFRRGLNKILLRRTL